MYNSVKVPQTVNTQNISFAHTLAINRIHLDMSWSHVHYILKTESIPQKGDV